MGTQPSGNIAKAKQLTTCVSSWLRTMFGERSLSKASMAIVSIFILDTHIMLETLFVETDSIPFARENKSFNTNIVT